MNLIPPEIVHDLVIASWLASYFTLRDAVNVEMDNHAEGNTRSAAKANRIESNPPCTD